MQKCNQWLTTALFIFSVRKIEWKVFAKEQVGLSIEKIEFLDVRKENPAMEIFTEYCGDWKLDRLYDALVKSGLSADADRYL